jgi:hypothetical protein
MDYTQSGTYPNPNGDSIFPGTTLTGPLIAGNVIASDGTGNLAGLGETQGTANAGVAVMSQSQVVTQAAGGGGGAGVFNSTIVLPSQSQILGMQLMVTTAWSGVSPNLGIGSTASATAFTAAGAVTGAGALGLLAIVPGTGSTQISNWDNVGTPDVQVQVTSTNTGAGVGTLTVTYAQGINLSS